MSFRIPFNDLYSVATFTPQSINFYSFRRIFFARIFAYPISTLVARGLAFLVMLGSYLVSTPADAQEMKLTLSPYCVSIRGGHAKNGAALTQWHCHGRGDQQWRFEAGLIRNPSVNKCLSVWNGDVSPGHEVVIWDCHGGADQRWILTSEGTVQNESRPNLCLSTFNGAVAPDVGLAVWDCHGQHDQRWVLSGTSRPVPDFIVINIQRGFGTGPTGRLEEGLIVKIKNRGAGAGRILAVGCSAGTAALQLSISRNLASNASTDVFLRLAPGVNRATCGVTGTSTDGTPESVTFNNSMTKNI